MSATIKAWDAFELTAQPLRGAGPLKGLKRGQAVSAGELLALQPDPVRGDVHASTNGRVEEINEIEIIIRRDEEAVGRPPEPQDLKALTGPDLAAALKKLGLDLPSAPPGGQIILSAMDPEPGLTLTPALFGEHWETVQAGLETAGRLWPEHDFIWAVRSLEDLSREAEGAVVEEKYPFTLPAFLKKKIIGQNDPSGGGVLTGRELFLLGRLWRTGRPLSISPLTLGGSNYFIPLGARVIDLLTFANLRPRPGDAVIKGGLIRGQSLGRLERGLDQSAAAIHLARGAGRAACEPCRECGACTRACPLKLPVDRPARFEPAEWLNSHESLFKLSGCLLCGVCALACPSRRPLLSLARLALAAIEAETAGP